MSVESAVNPVARVVIFGLARDTSVGDVQTLLRSCSALPPSLCADLPVEMFDVPGDNDESFAVVRLWPDRALAWRLADHLRTRRLRGRRLSSWMPAMAWS